MGEPGRQPPRQRPDNGPTSTRQPHASWRQALASGQSGCQGRAFIPRKIISQAATIATIRMTKSDQCGRWVRIIPVNIGLNAAPSHPQRLGGEVAGLHPRRGQYGQSAYTPRGHKSLPPRVKIAAEIPHAHRLAPENIKPTRPITKQTVPKVISGRIFLALSRRPTAYSQSDHHRGVNRQHHGHHFLGEVAAGDHQHILREAGGESAADEGRPAARNR